MIATSTSAPGTPTPLASADRLTAATHEALADLHELIAVLRRNLTGKEPAFALARLLLDLATFHRRLSDQADLLLLPPTTERMMHDEP